MIINQDLINRLAGSRPLEKNGEIQFSLFVTCKKKAGVKCLNLGHLSLEDRAKKLNEYAAHNRFVALIKRGDEVCLDVHAKFAAQLKTLGDLTIDGKKVTVIHGLSDVDYNEEMSQILTIYEQALSEDTQKSVRENDRDSSKDTYHRPLSLQISAFSPQAKKIGYALGEMMTAPSRLALKLWRQMEKARRKDRIEQEREETRKEILAQEIKRGILKQQTIEGEIEKQSLKQSIVAENSIQGTIQQ